MSTSTTPAWKRILGRHVLRTADALSAVGEAVGSQWLIYNPLVTMGFRRAALRNSPGVVEAIRATWPDVRRVVDVGCASGTYVKRLNDGGFDAIGVEFSERLRRSAAAIGQVTYPFDVSIPTPRPPGAPFDLAMSLEVAEHVPARYADAFVDYFRGLSRRILFTAAQPGQGGTGHINEQPKEYWIGKFARAGFDLDPAATEAVRERLVAAGVHWYLPANLSVFRAREQDD